MCIVIYVGIDIYMYMYEYWFGPFIIDLDLFFCLDEVDILLR